MPRDADALKIRKWAESGDVATPESQGLDRATGWPANYSQPNGDVPEREVMNQILMELSALGVDLNTHGLLEWDSSIAYAHPAAVMGSDGQPYLSVADSQGVDPVADNGNANWKLLALQGPTGPIGLVGPISQLTYESLNSNGDVGTASSQVAAGDHGHVIQQTGTVVARADIGLGQLFSVGLTPGTTYETLASHTMTTSQDLEASHERLLVVYSVCFQILTHHTLTSRRIDWRLRRTDHPADNNESILASGYFSQSAPHNARRAEVDSGIVFMEGTVGQRYIFRLEAQHATPRAIPTWAAFAPHLSVFRVSL